MNELFSTKRIALLLFIFGLSVLVRLPNLNRPLSKHHEFCTAIALQVMTAWDEEGIANFNYNPAMNFKNPNDKFINNWASSTGEIMDEKGNYYYLSHPPLAYYFPYAVFQVLQIKPGVLALQIFNLIIHFFCGIMIFAIVGKLTGVSSGFRLAFWAYGIYLFSAATLWFQGNVYMSDTLVIFFFILSIFLFLRWYSTRKIQILLLYLFSVFLMVYTSWLGVFYAIGFSLFWILKHRIENKILAVALLTWSFTFFALALMIWQYSLIDGFDAYLGHLSNRYQERGSLNSGDGFLMNKLTEIYLILKNYFTGYFPFLFIPLLWLVSVRWNKKWKLKYGSSLFLFLGLVPVLLLHLALMNYSGHDFVGLYGAPVISVSTVLILDVWIAQQIIKPGTATIAVVVGILVSVGSYYYINRPGSVSLNGERYAVQKELGERIGKEANTNEVVFIQGLLPEPQVIIYAKRNIKVVENREEAIHFLNTHGREKGVLFIVDTEGTISSIDRFGAD